jgi:sugar/nucleoside kinase (ribokinase family)
MSKYKSILCVGAALNDLLVQETDEYLLDLNKEKGGMTLVEKDDLHHAIGKTSQNVDSAPGGSACNTAVGLARLGGSVTFLGKRGNDEPGKEIEAKLKDWGVTPALFEGNQATGQVLSMITPDAQRTMMTFLGAASELHADEVSIEHFQDHDIVHIEGYLLFNMPFAEKVIELAKKANCKIAIDLSSFEVVNIFKTTLEVWLKEHIDILIANEDEAKAYTNAEPEESLEHFAELCELAIVKLGADGVLVAQGDQRERVSGNKVEAIDTTGAGDLWASGFFYGLMQGWDLDKAARLGCKTGAAVVQEIGAVIPDLTWKQLNEEKHLC